MAVTDYGRNILESAVNGLSNASGSVTSHSMNSAYVHWTSGTACAIRYICRDAGTIDAIYVFMSSPNGTYANITMQAYIYNEISANAERPGTTLRATATATTMPSTGTAQWVKFTFGTPYTHKAGEVLWVIVANTAAAPGTDYPNIERQSDIGGTGIANQPRWGQYYTSNGFSTNGTAAGRLPFVIVESGIPFGIPFTKYSSALIASSTNEKGLLVAVPTGIDLDFYGFEYGTGSTKWANAFLYDGSTAPGGTTLASWSLDSDTDEITNEMICGKIFDSAYRLTGGNTYRFVLDCSSAVAMTGWQIEDYSTYSTVFDALFNSWLIAQPTVENAGSWSNPGNGMPGLRMLVGVVPQTGGGGLLTHPGYAGRV